MGWKMALLLFVVAALVAGNIYQLASNSSRLYAHAVPNEETALAIARAILNASHWEGVFDLPSGSYSISLSAQLDRRKGVWIVTGEWPEVPEGYLKLGVLPEVSIRMRDGMIKRVRFI